MVMPVILCPIPSAGNLDMVAGSNAVQTFVCPGHRIVDLAMARTNPARNAPAMHDPPRFLERACVRRSDFYNRGVLFTIVGQGMPSQRRKTIG
jgi:hypothetical protein